MNELKQYTMPDFLFSVKSSNIDKIEYILKNSIKDKIEKGWIITQNKTYIGDDKECCAIGSLGPDESRMNFTYPLKFIYWLWPNCIPVSQFDKNLNSLIKGFDGVFILITDKDEFYLLGQRLWNFADELQRNKVKHE